MVLVSAGALVDGGDRCGQVGTPRAPVGAREPRHDAVVSWLLVVVVRYIRSGNGANERCRVGRRRRCDPHALCRRKRFFAGDGKVRPVNRTGRGVSSLREGAPPRAAGRCDPGRPGNQVKEPRQSRRPIEMSRCATTAETSMAARPRFERGSPGSKPGVVPVPPPRIGLDGRARTSNPRLPKPVRFRCATSRWY